MTIKEKIAHDIGRIEHPGVLSQILQFIRFIQSSYRTTSGNRDKVLSHRGVLSQEDAAEIQSDVNSSFHHIEGEW